jgi:hypothetical protein
MHFAIESRDWFEHMQHIAKDRLMNQWPKHNSSFNPLASTEKSVSLLAAHVSFLKQGRTFHLYNSFGIPVLNCIVIPLSASQRMPDGRLFLEFRNYWTSILLRFLMTGISPAFAQAANLRIESKVPECEKSWN